MNPDTAEETPTEVERRRRGPIRRVASVGAAASVVGAVLVGVLGADGAGGLAAAFVGASLTLGIAGLTALVGAVRDEAGGVPVPRSRIGLGIGLLLLAPVMLVLAAGAAGST